MAYGEVKKLTADNIFKGIDGRNWIQFNRPKTNIRERVPLLPKAEQIINKYSQHPTVQIKEVLLPVYSNQKTNKYIKEVAQLAKVNKDISFHTARHTFATTVTLSNCISIETVSKLLGYNKLATTQIYARVLNHKISDEISKLAYKFDAEDKQHPAKKAWLNLCYSLRLIA